MLSYQPFFKITLQHSFVGSAIACLLIASPVLSQIAQTTSDRNPGFLFKDVPLPVSQPCSATRMRADIKQLNLPSPLAINRIYYQRLIAECRALAVPALIQALKNPQENIRANAALAIGQIGTEASAAIPALIGLLDDKSNVVQINVAYALGQMGWMAEAALPALSDRLEDENRAVIASAANAIGQIGSSLLSVRYLELYGVVTERNGMRDRDLSAEGKARQNGLRLNLFAALYDAYNKLNTVRTNNRAAWNRDANAQPAYVSLIEAMEAVDVIDYVFNDFVSSCSSGAKSDVACVSGGAQLVATMSSHVDRNRPAVCRITPIRYVIPRCRTR